MQNISASQVSAEVPINENFLNLLWGELFARNPVSSSGLIWGYVGGQWPIDGVPTAIASGTISLTASSTVYIGATQAGAVVATNTTPNPLHVPLYVVVTGATAITSYTDVRSAKQLQAHAHGSASIAMGDANQTLTQAQGLCDTITTTGVLTAQRNLVVPLLKRRWAVRNSCTLFGVQVIGASGTGAVVAFGKTAIVECDGTNVSRVTADETILPLSSSVVAAALGATGSQTVTPASMVGITPGCLINVANADGSNSEQIRVRATTSTTFTAIFGSTKSASWTVRVLSTGWKPVMSGRSADTPGSWTYTLQEGSYRESNGRVHFSASVTWTATGGTGQLQMSLPVISANLAGYTACALSIFGAAGIVVGTAVANVEPNSAAVVFAAINTVTGGAASITSYATGTVYVAGSYEISP